MATRVEFLLINNPSYPITSHLHFPPSSIHFCFVFYFLPMCKLPFCFSIMSNFLHFANLSSALVGFLHLLFPFLLFHIPGMGSCPWLLIEGGAGGSKLPISCFLYFVLQCPPLPYIGFNLTVLLPLENILQHCNLLLPVSPTSCHQGHFHFPPFLLPPPVDPCPLHLAWVPAPPPWSESS